MSRQEAPAYFCVTDDPREPPAPNACTEGRLFLEDDELICGAGDPDVQDGYIGRIDSHTGSTARRILGRSKDFQEFDSATATGRAATQSVALGRVTDVETLEWDGSDLSGADETYGVRIASPRFGGDSLVVQLGRGWRNRGTGRNRHVALARLLRAKADTAESTVSDDNTSASHPARPDEPGSTTPADETTGDPDSWLADEESTALVARNYTANQTTVRVGCRTDERVRFRDDVTIEDMEEERWTDLPERDPFEIGIVPEDGESVVRRFDGTAEIEGDILVYVTPEEATIEASTVAPDVTETTTERANLSDEYSWTTRKAATLSDPDARRRWTRGGSVLAVGLVVWFGSVAFDGQPQEMVAVFGFLLTIYGLYRLVRG